MWCIKRFYTINKGFRAEFKELRLKQVIVSTLIELNSTCGYNTGYGNGGASYQQGIQEGGGVRQRKRSITADQSVRFAFVEGAFEIGALKDQSTKITDSSLTKDLQASTSAGPSNSKLVEQFLGMGFREQWVTKAIEKNGEGDHESILETLFTYQICKFYQTTFVYDSCHPTHLNSPQQQRVNNYDLSSDYDESLLDDFSDSDSWPGSELRSGFNSDGKMCVCYIELVMCAIAIAIVCPSASIADLIDFILAAQNAKTEPVFFEDELVSRVVTETDTFYAVAYKGMRARKRRISYAKSRTLDPILRPLVERDSETLQSLLPEIPLWVKNPYFDRVDWLNKQYARLQSPLLLHKYKIDPVEFETLTLGSLLPTFQGSRSSPSVQQTVSASSVVMAVRGYGTAVHPHKSQDALSYVKPVNFNVYLINKVIIRSRRKLISSLLFSFEGNIGHE
ncbi:hypothetical protein L6452_37121 [Arctium lappa]|uniref:Uncharacterized protein n=1 Tax=Arctium lappa TaxID=4217 RepID=A0ACB8Y344_ARCLA|nr:hypothetical protein L6452_37121 [Arctium lappa]